MEEASRKYQKIMELYKQGYRLINKSCTVNEARDIMNDTTPDKLKEIMDE